MAEKHDVNMCIDLTVCFVLYWGFSEYILFCLVISVYCIVNVMRSQCGLE